MTEYKTQTTFSGSELMDELKTMVGDSLQSSTKAFLRSLNLFKTVATQTPRQKVGALDMAKRWAQINLETSRIISRHSQESISEILDVLENYGLIDSDPEKMPFAESRQRPQGCVVIKLNAKRGQKSTGLFAVSNPSQKLMEATFAVSEFINEDKHVVNNVAVSFNPAKLNLLPNQEAAVEITIVVSKNFKVDKLYQAAIQIPEYPGKEIILQLKVDRATGTKTAKAKEKKA